MSFLTGFRNSLNKFRKTSQEKKSEEIKPAPISGEVIKPKGIIKTTEKKPHSVKVHKYNWVLLAIALILTAMALLIFTGQKKSEKTVVTTETAVIPQGDGGTKDITKTVIVESPIQKEELPKNTKAETIPALFQISPEKIEIFDQLIGEKIEKTLFISCAEGEFKILSIKLENPDLILETKKCDELATIKAKIDSCPIKITWIAKKDEKINTKLLIEWEDLSALNSAITTKEIPIILESSTTVPLKIIEEEPMPILPPPEPEVEKEDKGLFSDLFNDNKKEEIPTIQPTIAPKNRNLNCSRFASKAYSMNGNFLGWIRPSGEVFSARCTRKVGTRKGNGDVADLNGKIIGYEFSDFVKKLREKEEANNKMTMPEGLADFEDLDKQLPVDWQAVGTDRNTARSTFIANNKASQKNNKDPVDRWDKHQMKDHMGILKSAKMSKIPFTIKGPNQISTMPKDEEFVIRRNKPIPAVLSYPLQYNSQYKEVVPATAIVERNIYGGSGRTVVIPAGSLILGHATGNWPNTYTRFARVALVWDRLVRPDGAEFIFKNKPITGDAQGKLGVPGKGSTDYMEQFVKPMLSSLVPAAINLISPVSELYTRKVLTDKDNGELSILETGQQTSSEKAKHELIATWNKIAHKLVDDTLNNTTPPFVVPAGTRLTIYTKQDIMLRFVDDDALFKEAETSSELSDEGTTTTESKVTLDEKGKTVDYEVKANQMSGLVQDTVGQMGDAQKIRDAEEKAAAEAWEKALAEQDFSVDNNDPLESFTDGGGSSDPVIGTFNGTDVFDDGNNYYILEGNGDRNLTPDEEKNITKF